VNTDRVVIDTNVWLSAMLKSRTHKLVDLTVDYDVHIYTCPELTAEVYKNIGSNFFSKHIFDVPRQIELFKSITINQDIDKRFDRAADPKDNFLFDLAYSVKSHYVITQERALLNMKHVNKINIVSPTDFFNMVGMKWNK
jgi:putative PIN family toxin of toxin-antitoxin system